jgi:hypothetical protein
MCQVFLHWLVELGCKQFLKTVAVDHGRVSTLCCIALSIFLVALSRRLAASLSPQMLVQGIVQYTENCWVLMGKMYPPTTFKVQVIDWWLALKISGMIHMYTIGFIAIMRFSCAFGS